MGSRRPRRLGRVPEDAGRCPGAGRLHGGKAGIMMPTASVVIPTRNRCATLATLLERVAPQAEAAAAEVVVVDNGSTDGTPQTLRQLEVDGKLRIVFEPIPGATRARNAGARAARGEVIAFVDDDALPSDGWLTALLAPFESPRVAAAGGRVSLRFAGALPGWWDAALATYLAAYDLGPEPADLGARPWYDSPRGLNLAVRPDALLAVGGVHPPPRPRARPPRGGGECERREALGYLLGLLRWAPVRGRLVQTEAAG